MTPEQLETYVATHWPPRARKEGHRAKVPNWPSSPQQAQQERAARIRATRDALTNEWAETQDIVARVRKNGNPIVADASHEYVYRYLLGLVAERQAECRKGAPGKPFKWRLVPKDGE